MSRFAGFVLLVLLIATSSNAPADPPAPKKDDPAKGGIDRTGATRKRLLKDFGGSEESEEAVMLGLAWLTQMQKADGSWEYDGNMKAETAGATGMAVLSFLGAGQSHKDGRYKQTVQAGLNWLVKNLEGQEGQTAGLFRGATSRQGQIYAQGIATLALCEAYGVTQDQTLQAPAQAAIDYIQRVQAPNGSWGYIANQPGDTSIVGWQLQALHAAKLSGLKVDDKVIKKAVEFLNAVSSGPDKSVYGYNVAGQRASPTASLTAIGLLCRYYLDSWRAETPGYSTGTKNLLTRVPSDDKPKPTLDVYFYYYATQVVRFHGGDEWKTWNEGPKQPDGTRKGGVSDWLIGLQVRTPEARGSWDPPRQEVWISRQCGRLGTTCLCLLTLEVYYRYSPEAAENQPKQP